MVSNVLGMSAEELMEVLLRIRRDHGDDPEYREARSHLPAEWPI